MIFSVFLELFSFEFNKYKPNYQDNENAMK
jgi:hypothetical protein